MNLNWLFVLACAVLPWTVPVGLGAQDVFLSEDRLISDSTLPWPLTEPHLAAHPDDSEHLIVAAIAVRSVDWNVEFSTSCLLFVSWDRGESWSQHDFDLEECADPWVAVAPGGTAIFTALGRPRGADDGLWVWRSSDGGTTWLEPPQHLGRAFDHQTMTVDTTEGPFSGSVYLVAAESIRRSDGVDHTVHVARSADAGATFETHRHIVPSNLSLEAQNPVVLSNGTVVVPFQDHQALPRRRLERRRSWLVVSDDGGQTFSAPKFTTESCARSRPASWPSLAVDHSGGPFTDRLYWVCEEQDFEGVLVHYSTDRGESWSEPLRIGHEGVRNPYTKTPTIAVNADGVLGIVWYDGRGHPWHACHELFFSYSTDGAQSFSDPVAISTAPSCPYTPENGDAAWRWPGGGDYIGMIPLEQDQFMVAWSDSRDGTYRIRVATVRVP